MWLLDHAWLNACVAEHAMSSELHELRLRDTDSGRGHMVKSNVYNFRADAYTAIN